jgi:N-hydroxyarylamine O-acetyltransferase
VDAGNLNVTAYLRRLRYTGTIEPTLGSLRSLHRRHMETVPFENLDIWLFRRIEIENDASIRKIVDGHRGGFCYELNSAFAALLRALGFHVTLLSARVARENGGQGPEFDHLALQVDLDEPWLADVGFGDSFAEPLRLQPDLEQQQDVGTFRIRQATQSLALERRQADDSWRPEYSFTLAPRQIGEFRDRCHFHQTSPESSFTQKRICSRLTPEGRITLSELNLIVTNHGHREERTLGSEEEWRSALRQYFEILV